MKKILFALSFIFFIGVACYYKNNSNDINSKIDIKLVDKNATTETKALFYNLNKIATKYTLFGQQDATACGVGWKNEDLRSDINDVCGSFPSIYGWDIGKVGSRCNADSINFDRIKFWIKSAYERGSINIIIWRFDWPISNNNFTDTTRTVLHILPGGKMHDFYIQKLDKLADFILDLRSKKGTFIPIIFRPFQDQNENIYWWGKNHCTPEQFKTLWQFTVKYLRDKKNIHNVLYAYSFGRVLSDSNYLQRYPGKDFVDILGLDDYIDFQQRDLVPKAISQLRLLVNLAKRENKISALTETGQKCITDPKWWTKSLLYPIKNDSVAKNIAFIMVWRNEDINNYFAPFPGHPSVKNFIQFENDPYTLFEDDLPSMYEITE